MNPDVRGPLDVVPLPVAVANRRAGLRGHPGEALPVLREHRCQGASVADDRPVPAWPVSAGAAPFDSPVIWVAAVRAVVGWGVYCPLQVHVGPGPCCEVWRLLKATVQWAGPAGRPAGSRCGWGLELRLGEVSAAEVSGIGAQPVFEEPVSEQVPCEQASEEVPPVSAAVPSGAKQPWGLRV